jgi:rhodanese-related sulfurtransferase
MKIPFLEHLFSSGVPEVSPQELNTWLQEGRKLQLVDARSAPEYRQGTIGRARHAPVTDLPAALDRLNLDPKIPVVVLCLSGHRSVPGARLLRQRGLEAYSLKGGLTAWGFAGYRLNRPIG